MASASEVGKIRRPICKISKKIKIKDFYFKNITIIILTFDKKIKTKNYYFFLFAVRY